MPRRQSRLFAVILPVFATSGLALPATANAALNWGPLNTYIANNPSIVGSGAIVVYYKGVKVLERSFGTWTLADAAVGQPVDSVSKTFAAVVAMQVAQDTYVNQFQLTDAVSEHFADVNTINPAYSTMTIRHLMSMTGGIRGEISCPGSPYYTFNGCVRGQIVPSSLWQDTTTGAFATPGSNFVYGGPGWNVLGYSIVKAVALGYRTNYDPSYPEENWSQLVAGYLLAPCAMWNTGYTQASNFKIGGGIRTNLADGAKLAEILRTGQCTNDDGNVIQVLTQQSRYRMQLNQTSGASAGASAYDGLGDRALRSYGLGLWRNDAGPVTTSLGGSFHFGAGANGSHIFFDADKQYSGFIIRAPGTFYYGTLAFEGMVTRIKQQIDDNP